MFRKPTYELADGKQCFYPSRVRGGTPGATLLCSPERYRLGLVMAARGDSNKASSAAAFLGCAFVSSHCPFCRGAL